MYYHGAYTWKSYVQVSANDRHVEKNKTKATPRVTLPLICYLPDYYMYTATYKLLYYSMGAICQISKQNSGSPELASHRRC